MKGKVGAIVGIEWDQLDGKPWPAFDNGPSDMTHEVQFCQWTLAGAAGHPLFKNAAMMSVERIKALAAARQESITDLDPTGHVCQAIARPPPPFFPFIFALAHLPPPKQSPSSNFVQTIDRVSFDETNAQ
jgi:mannosyltransferase OCH1-like enzyme